MATFFVRWKRKTWSLLKQEYVNGKSLQTTVPRDLYKSFGFNPEWSLEEAKKRVRQLNGKGKIDRLKAISAARNHNFKAITESVFVDVETASDFQGHLLSSSFAANDKKIISHWKTVVDLIKTLSLEPREFSLNSNRIFKLLMERRYSIDYVTKLIRIMNLWGSFLARKQNFHFDPIITPRGHIREKLHEAYLSKPENRAGGATPLTPKLLNKYESRFLPGQFEWMFVSLWFGLRPKEVTGDWKLSKDDDVDVLHIYQSKLTSVKKELRWKLIPVLYPEQKRALSMLKLGGLKRPLLKTITAIFGEGYGLYSGRKGFTDLMLDLGQEIDAISAWLGHQSLDMTWKRYKNRNRVQYKKPG